MNIEEVKKEFLKQLEDGFDARKFETYILKYLKVLVNNDEDVTKALHYFDLTNRVVRIYIRTKENTYNVSFPMDKPSKIRSSTFKLSASAA